MKIPTVVIAIISLSIHGFIKEYGMLCTMQACSRYTSEKQYLMEWIFGCLQQQKQIKYPKPTRRQLRRLRLYEISDVDGQFRLAGFDICHKK